MPGPEAGGNPKPAAGGAPGADSPVPGGDGRLVPGGARVAAESHAPRGDGGSDSPVRAGRADSHGIVARFAGTLAPRASLGVRWYRRSLKRMRKAATRPPPRKS